MKTKYQLLAYSFYSIFIITVGCAEKAQLNITTEDPANNDSNQLVKSIPIEPTAFYHIANPENTNGSLTFLDAEAHPEVSNLKTNLIVSNVTFNSIGGVINNSNIAVYFDPLQSQWGILNLNGNPIKNGTRFSVMIPGSRGYDARMTTTNAEDGDVIHIPQYFLENIGTPQTARLIVTPVYELGSSISPATISIRRDSDTSDVWRIRKENGGNISSNEKYNIYIASSSQYDTFPSDRNQSAGISGSVETTKTISILKSGDIGVNGIPFFTLDTTVSEGFENLSLYLSIGLVPASINVRERSNADIENTGLRIHHLSVH